MSDRTLDRTGTIVIVHGSKLDTIGVVTGPAKQLTDSKLMYPVRMIDEFDLSIIDMMRAEDQLTFTNFSTKAALTLVTERIEQQRSFNPVVARRVKRSKAKASKVHAALEHGCGKMPIAAPDEEVTCKLCAKRLDKQKREQAKQEERASKRVEEEIKRAARIKARELKKLAKRSKGSSRPTSTEPSK